MSTWGSRARTRMAGGSLKSAQQEPRHWSAAEDIPGWGDGNLKYRALDVGSDGRGVAVEAFVGEKIVGDVLAFPLPVERLHVECQALVQDLYDAGHGPEGPLEDAPLYEVRSSGLHPGRRGEHIGRRLYKLVIGRLRQRARGGFYFINNECGTDMTSDDAGRVWESIARRYPSRDAVESSSWNVMYALWIGRKRVRLAEIAQSP